MAYQVTTWLGMQKKAKIDTEAPSLRTRNIVPVQLDQRHALFYRSRDKHNLMTMKVIPRQH